MERLTFDGNFCDIVQCENTPNGSYCESGGSCFLRKVWERLKAYEDTRLEPEEIDMDHEAAEQLRQLCRDCDLDRLEKLPAADVAPVVHGRWIPFHSKISGDIQYCSACEIGFAAKADYCPHCGAKMDGGDNTER